MGVQWQEPPAEVFERGTAEYARALHQYVLAVAQRWVPEIENWMKENAIWTDRTGNARQGLWSDVMEIVNSAVIILLGHGVEYGIFLELANAGRYAIVLPALDRFLPKIWADVRAGLAV